MKEQVLESLERLRTAGSNWCGTDSAPPRSTAIDDAVRYVMQADELPSPIFVESDWGGTVELLHVEEGDTIKQGRKSFFFEGNGSCSVVERGEDDIWRFVAEFFI